MARKPGPTRGASFDVAAIRSAMGRVARAAQDPRHGSVIGRMHLARELTDRQFAAAEAYGKLRRRHDRIIGLPRRSAQGLLYDEQGARRTAEMGERAVLALRGEHAALVAVAGPAKAMLDRIILDDEAPQAGEMARFKAALDGLAGWLGDER